MPQTESIILEAIATERGVAVRLLEELLRIERSPVGRHGSRGINTRVAQLLDDASAGRVSRKRPGAVPPAALDDVSLTRLKLQNFMQFRRADLRPETTGARPICLITGQNGYGKSALVSAVHWVLHGTLPAWCKKTPGRLVHAALDGPVTKMEVELELSSVFDGHIVVRRFVEFRRRAQGWVVQDHGELVVSLAATGKVHRGDDAKEWLHSRFPPDVLSYFAFDAESAVVQKLSGQAGEQLPDIAPMVEAALDITPVKRVAERCRKRARALGAELKELSDDRDAGAIQSELDGLAARIARIEAERESLLRRIADQRSEVQGLSTDWERLTSAIDPNRRSHHDMLAREVEALEADLRQCEDVLTGFCDDGLPHLLLAAVVEGLGAGDAPKPAQWREGASDACGHIAQLAIDGAIPWRETPMPTAETLRRRLIRLIGIEPDQASGSKPVPARLAASVRVRAETARRRVPSASLPHRVADLRARRDALRAELRELAQPALDPGWKAELNDKHDSLTRASAALSHAETQLQALDSSLEAAQDQYGALEDTLGDARERDRARAGFEQRIQLAEAVYESLMQVAGRLREDRVETLERAATRMLRRIAHKSEIFERLSIDRQTLRYALLDTEGRPVPPGRSTGERTVLALCLVYGLQKTSGCRFPLVLEAPLKPLDADHQEAVLRHFLTAYPGQTILLVKPGEIPAAYMELCRERIATRLQLIRPEPGEEWTNVANDPPEAE